MWTDECIEATHLNHDGYGVGSAHRVAYIAVYGYPPRGHDVHHKCENRACFNPLHLEAVTKKRNSQLRRYTKVPESDYESIRSRWRAGETQIVIAKEYGVTPTRICQICKVPQT